MTSVLESEYKCQTRPYSQNELQDTRNNQFRKLRVGVTRAHHKCNHFYHVKENGRKEKNIKTSKNPGNC